MHFQWPSFAQMTYRLMRLRRLIALAAMIPLIVLLGSSIADPTALAAPKAVAAILGVSCLVTLHAVLFPNVTLETLALSLAATLLVVAMPSINAVAQWAPVAHQTGALIILMGLAVAATGVAVALFQIVLSVLVYAGPAMRRRLTTTTVVPCSTDVAFQQLALRPQLRRGRILTGAADENGFFEVVVAASPNAHHPDDLVRLDARVMHSDCDRHDVMLSMRDGAVTVTSQRFQRVVGGCEVCVTDVPGDFTAGMYVLFWLTDQHADNLTEMTDLLFGGDVRANGLAHTGSLLAAAGAILSPRGPDTHPTE